MRAILASLIFSCVGLAVSAQDFQGTWQGHIMIPNEMRYMFRIDRAGPDWRANVVVDQDTGTPWLADNISVSDGRVAFAIKVLRTTFEGQLSPDGQTLTGIVTTGGAPFPIELARATPVTEWKETPHNRQMVKIDPETTLEVLDWGGRGRTLVLLAGLGNSAHLFDAFAAKLVKNFRVYGITRRGWGASTATPMPTFPTVQIAENSCEMRPVPAADNPYDSDRLGDDIVKVLDVLHLEHPILVGHSIAGAELSSIALRHPKRVSGVVYLEALYNYAYVDGTGSDVPFSAEYPMRISRGPDGNFRSDPGLAMLLGQHEYKSIPVPALAICASPMVVPSMLKEAGAVEGFKAFQKRAADRYALIQQQLPNLRIVLLPNAAHHVYRTNESDVLREMNAFIRTLPNG